MKGRVVEYLDRVDLLCLAAKPATSPQMPYKYFFEGAPPRPAQNVLPPDFDRKGRRSDRFGSNCAASRALALSLQGEPVKRVRPQGESVRMVADRRKIVSPEQLDRHHATERAQIERRMLNKPR